MGRFPSYFVDLPGERFYGFPSIAGSGLKIGSHDAGIDADPDQVDRRFGATPQDEGDLGEMVERFFPGVSRRIKKGQVCLVTWTPDDDFVSDRHPEHAHVLILSNSPCFKMKVSCKNAKDNTNKK